MLAAIHLKREAGVPSYEDQKPQLISLNSVKYSPKIVQETDSSGSSGVLLIRIIRLGVMNIAVTTHLREVRKSKVLTQKEVAETLLISKDSLSRYERGEQDPRLDVAIRLSKYYNVSMESLYDIQN